MADGIDLGKKLGPLPLGGWIVAVGGGLAAAYYFNKKKKSAGGIAAGAAVGYDANGNPIDANGNIVPNGGQGTLGGGLVGQGGGYTPTPIAAPSGGGTAPKTNSDWAVAAAQYLLSKGMEGTIVSAAISNFLYGKDLSAQQQAMINQAIAAIGPPPEALPPPTTNPSPIAIPPTPPPPVVPPVQVPPPVTPPPTPPPPPPPPSTRRTFTVTPWPSQGSTLWGISTIEYGNGNRYMDIARANNISNPDLIYPGQVLVIP